MSLDGIRYRYPGRAGFTLGPIDLREGPTPRPLLILGATGSGKSTLLRLLGGNLRPRAGSFAGFDPRAEAAYLPQLPERALAGRNLAEDLDGVIRPPAGRRAELRRVLKEVGLDGVPLSRRSDQLSAGERRRVALGVLSLAGHRHWALDEPDAGLDARGCRQLLEVLDRRLAEHPEGRLWLASHRFELYAPLHPRVIVLERGRVLAQGSLQDVLIQDTVLQTLRIELRSPFQVWKMLQECHGSDAPIPLAKDYAFVNPRIAQVKAVLMDRAGFR